MFGEPMALDPIIPVRATVRGGETLALSQLRSVLLASASNVSETSNGSTNATAVESLSHRLRASDARNSSLGASVDVRG